MIRVFFSFTALLLAVVLEATIIRVPLTLSALMILGVVEKRGWLFFAGLFAGLLLDSLTFRLLGVSSLFFLFVLGILFLYGKKFETHHLLFGTFFTCVMSTLYVLLFGSGQRLSTSAISIAVSVSIFFCVVFLLHFLTAKTAFRFPTRR